MSLLRLAFVFTLAGVAAVGGLVYRTDAQEAAPPVSARPQNLIRAVDMGSLEPVQAGPAVDPYGVTVFRTDAGTSAQVQVNPTSAAVQKYQTAETDEARAAAEKELREAVTEQFELLVKEREEQIADLQARLAKLTEQLQKRRDAKDQIVDLRVQVLINEAKGLGFHPDAGSSFSDFVNDGRWSKRSALYGSPNYPDPVPRPGEMPLKPATRR